MTNVKYVEPTEEHCEIAGRWIGDIGPVMPGRGTVAQLIAEAESRGERMGLERAATFAETQGKAYSNMAQLAKCIRALAAKGER